MTQNWKDFWYHSAVFEYPRPKRRNASVTVFKDLGCNLRSEPAPIWGARHRLHFQLEHRVFFQGMHSGCPSMYPVWFQKICDFSGFLRFRRISRIFMFSVKIQLPPPPAPESFINVTISWCFRGAPFCETNIFVKIAVFGEIRWFSWKSVNFTENHDFHENDDFAGNGTPETSIIL